MVAYSNAEMSDMVFMYGRANGNSLQARRFYAETFPDRQLPSHVMFQTVFQRLRETGSFEKRSYDTGRQRIACTPQIEDRILNIIVENPETSVRRISTQVGVSSNLVWRTLHEQLLYPYHIQRVQALTAPDYQARRTFCEWFLRTAADRPDFADTILFTDEAGFTKNGIFNFHNNHVWCDENPHATVESRHQQRFSLNIWLGMIGERLLGPIVLPQRLTGPAYLEFLGNTLPELLEDLPINLRLNLWFMQDGAPPHFTRAVREHLNNEFHGRWIGRAGPIAWPPRSPDLNPLDFSIWGYLKSLVYATPVNDLPELRQRIERCCQIIREKPLFFERVRASFERRCRSCVEMEGRHFEHLL